jgi:hypothetical protein
MGLDSARDGRPHDVGAGRDRQPVAVVLGLRRQAGRAGLGSTENPSVDHGLPANNFNDHWGGDKGGEGLPWPCRHVSTEVAFAIDGPVGWTSSTTPKTTAAAATSTIATCHLRARVTPAMAGCRLPTSQPATSSLQPVGERQRPAHTLTLHGDVRFARYESSILTQPARTPAVIRPAPTQSIPTQWPLAGAWWPAAVSRSRRHSGRTRRRPRTLGCR